MLEMYLNQSCYESLEYELTVYERLAQEHVNLQALAYWFDVSSIPKM